MRNRVISVDEMNQHVFSFKLLIETLCKDASKGFQSVKEKSLASYFETAKVNLNYRGPLMDFLKTQNFLITQNEKVNLRYKFVEPVVKIDSEVIAKRAWNIIYQTVNPRVQRQKTVKLHKEEEFKGITEQAIAKNYYLSDEVFFLYESEIASGQIFGMSFASNGVEINTEIMTFQIAIPSIVKVDEIKTVWKNQIFPSPELLLKSLEVKFYKSNQSKLLK